MTDFEGIWVPLVTPFRDGRVDAGAAQALAEKLIAGGVHGLVVCGTTGEAATLDDDEQAMLLAAILEAADSRCPVMMGIAGSDTRAVAHKVASFDRHPLAGFLVSAPSYVRPSQQGIRLHFETVAAATDRPIVIYNIPSRTAVDIELATAAALARNPRFAAIKECSGIARLTDLVNTTPLKVLCGEDTLLLATLCLGGHGAISAAAHICPELYVRLLQLVRAGRIEQARLLFNALLPLIRMLFSEPNPAPVKAALALQGSLREELRLPMMPMSAQGRARLEVELHRIAAVPLPL